MYRPLRRGFRTLLRDTRRLAAWAQHNDGSRALEATFASHVPALPPALQRKAVAAVVAAGLVPQLALHPKASWCVAAMWRCDALAGGRDGGARCALRAAFAAALRGAAGLQATNPRLWQCCGLDDAERDVPPDAKRQKTRA